MKCLAALLSTILSIAALSAGDATAPAASAPPDLRITPGKVIIPTGTSMRRIWGELVSMDLATRTGTFRKDGTDQLMPFAVMPYAELHRRASHLPPP